EKPSTAQKAAAARMGSRASRIRTRDRLDEALICECEEVSVGEVKNAIERLDASTLTDLRRRTRIGMGTCQGEFCACRAAGLLAKAHGCIEKERDDLKEFLQERWKGNFPIGWGDTLREAEYTQWVYKHVLGL
ncbi:MAG: (2Fe-2S)-binding protein, partial [Bacteroidales bacterium]|nr:(2Fe-2S)-binding protein [Bacteroidales bacterium]